ncbi:MAG: P-loop NTPase [Anaerovoracaceae bacterium]|jgi:Mrp family chromosome partitioning ATPase
MSEGCNHDCASCSENCAQRDPASFLQKPHEGTHVNKVIAVVSGKGGVGKSLVTGLAAVTGRREGKNIAVLDADVTGPSIPKMFGIGGHAMANEEGIIPTETRTGIKMMSTNLVLEDPEAPVIVRGPVISGLVSQFWTDVLWGDIDYMFIDMPPGTGDVPLTVFQSIPVDGIIVVTSPQELVSMIVGKALQMAEKMNVPCLGLIENMSYVQCPDCGKHIPVFGESHVDEVAEKYNVPVLAKLPIVPDLATLCDNGAIEAFEGNWLSGMLEKL